jgi:hypothetical protein
MSALESYSHLIRFIALVPHKKNAHLRYLQTNLYIADGVRMASVTYSTLLIRGCGVGGKKGGGDFLL